MIKRALTLGSAVLSIGLFGPVQAAHAAGAPVVISPMLACATPGLPDVNRSTVLSRANTWVAEKLPYSQTVCHTDANGTYRTDCSGFISMAWGLTSSYVTSTLPSVSTVIDKTALQPGDILDLPSTHVVMFVGWYDEAHTLANFYQEGSTATGTYASTGVPLSHYASYTAYRYNNITTDAVHGGRVICQTAAGRPHQLCGHAAILSSHRVRRVASA